jgi:hypothetical protein
MLDHVVVAHRSSMSAPFDGAHRPCEVAWCSSPSCAANELVHWSFSCLPLGFHLQHCCPPQHRMTHRWAHRCRPPHLGSHVATGSWCTIVHFPPRVIRLLLPVSHWAPCCVRWSRSGVVTARRVRRVRTGHYLGCCGPSKAGRLGRLARPGLPRRLWALGRSEPMYTVFLFKFH